MKRRKFLKTVGGATAATALGGCTTTPPTTPAPIKAAAKTKKGRPALTYRLEEVTPGNATDSPDPAALLASGRQPS